MQRILGGFETAAALVGEAQALNVVFVLRLSGAVALERLDHALGSLQRRHPLLRARIVRDGRRYRFVDGAPGAPLRTVRRTSEAAWRAVVEEELGEPVDLGAGPALRCAYLPPAAAGGASEIVLTVHHAVLDGASSAPLLTELLALCDASAAVVAGETELPPPAETLFPPRFRGWRRRPSRGVYLLRQLADETAYRLRGSNPARPPSAPPVNCRILPLVLKEEATASLVRRSRRERATLNGALTAALLLAVQRHLYDGRAGSMRYFAFADLRPYLDPTPATGTLAAYVAPLRLAIRISADAGLWPLARQVSRQISATARRGDKFHAAELAATMMGTFLRRGRARMATVALSYTGAVRFAAGSGGLEVRGLHAFVSNVSRGPELTASVKLVDERLVWDIVYLDSDMDAALAKRMAGEIVRILAPGAHEGGQGP